MEIGDARQQQTNKSFSYKWGKRETYESERVKQKSYQWLVDRYFGSEEAHKQFLKQNKGKIIMDAGCGSGYSSLILFGEHLNEMQYIGVDSSDAVETARERFHELGIRGDFVKDSLTTMKLPEKADIIFCEGVLHHTSDPYKSFGNLVSHLNDDGIIMFYVYKKKAPVREYTDDFVREKLQSMTNDEAWAQLMPVTKLGKTLGDLNVEVEIDEDISLLEIPKGKYNLQRLMYWFFIKMYYDKKFTLDEMNHINFDWFRPSNCYRFNPEDIEKWLRKMNLKKIRFRVEEAGITVVAKKV